MARPTRRGFAAGTPGDGPDPPLEDGDASVATVFGRDTHLADRPALGKGAEAAKNQKIPVPPSPSGLERAPPAPRRAAVATPVSGLRAGRRPRQSPLLFTSIVIVAAAALVSFLVVLFVLKMGRS